jgi:hypothetical protein
MFRPRYGSFTPLTACDLNLYSTGSTLFLIDPKHFFAHRSSYIIEPRINKGTLYLSLMGRGDFSRPDFGRLKPPLPRMNAQKTSSITFAKFNNFRPSSIIHSSSFIIHRSTLL